mmetsp:Transcript_66983/g.218043  ORF Transcript_66983/g.218043 Transcript_66983/m.218043 type:complete len:283 (+) Transcript_66983:1182-2030(+)
MHAAARVGVAVVGARGAPGLGLGAPRGAPPAAAQLLGAPRGAAQQRLRGRRRRRRGRRSEALEGSEGEVGVRPCEVPRDARGSAAGRGPTGGRAPGRRPLAVEAEVRGPEGNPSSTMFRRPRTQSRRPRHGACRAEAGHRRRRRRQRRRRGRPLTRQISAGGPCECPPSPLCERPELLLETVHLLEEMRVAIARPPVGPALMRPRRDLDVPRADGLETSQAKPHRLRPRRARSPCSRCGGRCVESFESRVPSGKEHIAVGQLEGHASARRAFSAHAGGHCAS